MRRFLARSVLSAFVLTLTSVMAYAQGAGAAGSTTTQTTSSTAQFNLWWYSDTALATFLKTSHPGVTIISEANSGEAAAVLAGGYKLMKGLGGYAAIFAQGQNENGTSSPSQTGYIEGIIDAYVKSGATYIYVDEPWSAPNDPSGTATSAMSIAYNVKGFNILYNYIHTKHPGVQFGLTIGDDGGAGLHLAMLRAGLKEDFASEEEYNSCCTTTNPFTTQQTEFPNVKLMTLAYNTESLCQGSWLAPKASGGVLDIVGFWDVDNYGGWIGPWMDASWLQNAETFASTGKKAFCSLPVSYVATQYWTWNTMTKTFTVSVVDGFYQPSAYPLGTCEWMVMSGTGGANGPSDPSMKTTLPWTSRACNGNITVTVGINGYCNVIGSLTCLVFTRARNTNGTIGNVTYQEYTVSY